MPPVEGPSLQHKTTRSKKLVPNLCAMCMKEGHWKGECPSHPQNRDDGSASWSPQLKTADGPDR